MIELLWWIFGFVCGLWIAKVVREETMSGCRETPLSEDDLEEGESR